MRKVYQIAVWQLKGPPIKWLVETDNIKEVVQDVKRELEDTGYIAVDRQDGSGIHVAKANIAAISYRVWDM